MRSSADRSCEADAMSASRSCFISLPSMIFVFMLARMVFGMTLLSCVIATSPTRNLRPSFAIVAYMLSLSDVSTSLPITRGASSMTTAATGSESSVPVAFASRYSSNSFVAIMLPTRSSASVPRRDVSRTTTRPSFICPTMVVTVPSPCDVASNTEWREIRLPSLSSERPSSRRSLRRTTDRVAFLTSPTSMDRLSAGSVIILAIHFLPNACLHVRSACSCASENSTIPSKCCGSTSERLIVRRCAPAGGLDGV